MDQLSKSQWWEKGRRDLPSRSFVIFVQVRKLHFFSKFLGLIGLYYALSRRVVARSLASPFLFCLLYPCMTFSVTNITHKESGEKKVFCWDK